MKTCAICLIAIFSASLAGCATSGVGEGAGYELLTPSRATAEFIVSNDRPFAEQVVGHNRQCRADDGCRK